MKFIQMLYLCCWMLSSCVLSESTINSAEMPSVWQKNHGTIDYQDRVTKEKGKLTTFWAQEAIGAPEAREFMRQQPIKKIDIGVVDDGKSFSENGLAEVDMHPKIRQILCSSKYKKMCSGSNEDHATKVTNLIVGKQPVGVSSTAKLSFIADFYGDIYSRKELPPIMNYSGYVPNYDEIPDIVKHFGKFVERTILVKSSGNNFLTESIGAQIRDHGKKMVIVGSVDPAGFVSYYSQPHIEVSVLAPSDRFVQSLDNNSRLGSFSGTSGAAPQVTGALADVKSILPSLTRDESILLLRATSTPTSINEVSVANGAGTLNHYRAVRVAKRLKDKNFDRSLPADRQALLENVEIYDFKDDAQKLADEAKKLADPSAIQQETKLKLLRKAFFLDPDNLPVRKSLAEFYSSYGFSIQSRFYDDPKHVIEMTNTYNKLRLRRFKTVARRANELLRDVSGKELNDKMQKEFDERIRKMFLDGHLDELKLSVLEQSGYSKNIMRVAITAAGDLADKGFVEPLKLLLDRAKVDYKDLLDEDGIVLIVKKHQHALSALGTFIRLLPKDNFLKVIRLI